MDQELTGLCQQTPGRLTSGSGLGSARILVQVTRSYRAVRPVAPGYHVPIEKECGETDVLRITSLTGATRLDKSKVPTVANGETI